jgi:hypothetical protein
MFEHMDVRVRAGPPTARSAGRGSTAAAGRGFIASASVRHNGLWLLSAVTESDSRAQRTKALFSIFIAFRFDVSSLRDVFP